MKAQIEPNRNQSKQLQEKAGGAGRNRTESRVANK
jgi:hypothetical protein